MFQNVIVYNAVIKKLKMNKKSETKLKTMTKT